MASTSSSRNPLFGRALRIGSSLGRPPIAGPKPSRNPSETKGSFGLTTLYQPSSGGLPGILVHIVFVHGLGGGSEHTWTKGSVFWPRDLLPLEPGYSNTAIHTFGYDSDFKASNVLDISDFAKSLLGNRIRAIYFVATPHQGSEHATMLSKLFRSSPDLRPYLHDLQKNSEGVKAINEEFPRHSKELVLVSFYESRPLSIAGIGKRLIVEKANAVLSYENERSELLNGDHRSICKFDGPEDTNYIAIHQALTGTIDIITSERPARSPIPGSVGNSETRNQVIDLLGSFDTQEEDLDRVTSERASGTCEWLSENPNFDNWAFSDQHTILWLRGPPAAGKSFIAGYAIEQLQQMGKDVCYYFFTYGDKAKSAIPPFLRSMACQMAVRFPSIANQVETIISKDAALVHAADYRSIWRRLWLQGILRTPDDMKDVVWVIDALDECRVDGELLKLLVRIQDTLRIKLLVTSRKSPEDYEPPPKDITYLALETEDTQKDISAYLDEHYPLLEAKSKLRAVQAEPSGMESLYSRILESMPNPDLSRTILTLVVCVMRALTVEELQYMLRDFRDDDDSRGVRGLITQSYYDLLYIDSRDQVRLRHASARDFLLRNDINEGHPGLAIDPTGGHKAITLMCIEYLSGPEMDSKTRRRITVSRPARSPFVAYASHYLYEHLNRSSAVDNEILTELAKFLQSHNVLTWIEYSATENDLETVLQTAQALKDFLRRKSRLDLLLGDEVVIIDRWATDLVKLVTKFGRQLLRFPPSIFGLIPPFCPRDSAPYEQFAADKIGLSVVGLSASSWDDCLCTVSSNERQDDGEVGINIHTAEHSVRKPSIPTVSAERLRSIASTEGAFAIGTSLGNISIFNDRTCLQAKSIDHPVAVTNMQFAVNKPLLASASNRLLCIWNTETWKRQWDIKIAKECMALAFVDDDQILLAALRSSRLLILNLIEQSQTEVDWTRRLEERYGDRFRGRAPLMASFQADIDALAVVYRGQDIVVWNYEDNTQRLFNRDRGLVDGSAEPMVQVLALAFSHLPGSSLLVASYSVQDLVLFDVYSDTVKARVSSTNIYARLTSSPDGRTFAAAAVDGTIELYDFETLSKLYRIQSGDRGVTVLAFTADSSRLLDIRGDGRSCRVWEPSALYRRDIERDSLRTPSIYSQESYVKVVDHDDDDLPIITALAVDNTGNYFFVGKDDGTVWAYEARNGTPRQNLYNHGTTILKLQYNGNTSNITSVDTAGIVMIYRIEPRGTSWLPKLVFSLRSSGTGIQHIISNPAGSHLLLCVNDEASVHMIESQNKVVSTVKCNPTATGGYCWAPHPTRPDVLILLSENKFHLYSWEGLRLLTPAIGISREPSMLSVYHVRAVIPLLDGSLMAVQYSSADYSVKSHFFCFEVSELSTEDHEMDQGDASIRVCRKVKHLVGTYRGRHIFMNTDGWICSASIAAFQGHEKVAYHFMAPTNWLATNGEVLIEVSKSGDILVSCRHEVAVVKRGLERDYEIEER
ncbi:hypothetical protein VMCG_06614 [Cytospora schulzeri]|uniref:Uncharacterized protein n=1 Tax=Cytospora schulzeri TaxID=448051 RepID=A0A423W6S9_9PEZI|nr:hypothetical protein VMCG_06614 [Valsa malicola]